MTGFPDRFTAPLLLLFFVAPAMAQQAAMPPQRVSTTEAANSKVRIVRLSEVRGVVKIDRNMGRGYESAMANLPLNEGVKLETFTGLAEIEFEDNSTLRMAPDTLVNLAELEMRPSGAKLSTIQVLRGTVYVSRAATKGDEFALNFGSTTLQPTPSSHIRLQMTPREATLSVLEGKAEVEQPSGVALLGKKRSMTLDLTNPAPPKLQKTIADSEYDVWDKQSVDYHKSFANSRPYGNSPYAYGVSDMNYYGSFIATAGCGSMWRPYLASAAWGPFDNGAWAWDSGAGYSWVSPYPWGWMPYHYGSWSFCSGVGWGWQPGGVWMGSTNLTLLTNGRSGPQAPMPPLNPPPPGKPSLLAVNRQPMRISSLQPGGSFVFQNNSAGLGIPRGSRIELRQISSRAQTRGSVSIPVILAPAAREGAEGYGSGHGRSTGSSAARSGLQTGGRDAGFSSSIGAGEARGMASAGAAHGSSSGGGHSH